MIKPHCSHVDTTFLFGFIFLPKIMFSFCSILLASVCTWIFKIYGFFCKYVYRKEDELVPEDSSVFLPRGLSVKEGLDLDGSITDEDQIVQETECSVLLDEVVQETECSVLLDEIVEETECSVFLQSKCEFVSSKSMIEYLVEEPKTVEFTVEEMFVGSHEVLITSDLSSNCERELDKKLLAFDEESSSLFRFSLFNASLPTNEVVYEEKEKPNYVQDEEIVEEEDSCYEVELLPLKNEPENWMSNYLDRNIEQQYPETFDGSDSDDYIELEIKESTFFKDEELLLQKQDIVMQSEAVITTSSSDSEDEEEEEEDDDDVLSEHEHLVQQMKMELKNCSRIGGLPTISEECETPKIAEDLKPLQINKKIEYKDVIEEIHKFYKIYMEKMRKLDILNYQTLHAISFFQMKDSEEVSTACKKNGDLMPSILPKFWTRKVQRIYADPMHKSIKEMHYDLELIYVAQLCLSWEILCWLYVKGQELLNYDSQVNNNNNRSYNRAAEEFQQFQVLMQRFIEDEHFQGLSRNQNYVKRLLHVPIIKDDCLKEKKERKEETDAISLQQLVEIIKESIMIFREFIFTDKKAINVVLKGIQEPQNSELLVDILSKLQKKDRRVREKIRSDNCIVKKLRKNRQECRKDCEILISEVELRLVYRVLNVSRLRRDHLVWCQKKLDNINFVGKKVHVDTSFMLFPC